MELRAGGVHRSVEGPGDFWDHIEVGGWWKKPVFYLSVLKAPGGLLLSLLEVAQRGWHAHVVNRGNKGRTGATSVINIARDVQEP